MVETKNHLSDYGVDIDVNLKSNPNLSDYDIVHIFNIQNIDYSLKQMLNAKNKNKPTALSTIYWDLNYILNLKDQHLYSTIPLIRKMAKINKNVPHYGLKFLYYNSNRIKKNKIKLILKKADILLPNSYSELEILAILFKMPEIRQKAVIIPNGISCPKLNSVYTQKINKLPKEYILEVANIGIIKGQLNLIKALFDYPEIPLVFIGSGLETPYGKECISLGKKRTNTYFLGKIDHDKIYYYYSNARVHVLPSLRESPGLATLEAAIFGINCVVSFHAPVAEYFGLNVFCCDPLNVESIKSSVLDAWNSPKNDKLKHKILKSFTWEKAALKTLEAYQYVLNKQYDL